MAELLEVKNLSVSFFTPAGEVQAVRDVSFSLRAGEVLAIVGESGCGKSVLCKSILHLLPPSARRKSGTIAVNGRDITRLRERELQKLRGSLFSMVFQDPMTALNPSMTVGAQLAAAVRVHAPRLRGAALEQRVLELMRLVGIDRPEERRGLYPHHFSGGMRQRVVLAIALAGDPSILFADEPTTALDVTIQAQILELLKQLRDEAKMSVVLITHDLGVVASLSNRISVMYGGLIMEEGLTDEIFYAPKHPYTRALLHAIPQPTTGVKERLEAIPGMAPSLTNPPAGCPFAERCKYACEKCESEIPAYRQYTRTQRAMCVFTEEELNAMDKEGKADGRTE